MANDDEYRPRTWLPNERPTLPGSPSFPTHSPAKRLGYLMVGLLVAMTGGLGNSLVTANLVNLQGTLGAYASEMQWLPAAYVMTTVSMNLLLVKFRQQFGLRLYTEFFLVLYALVAFAHLFVHNLGAAIAVRAAHGLAAGALSTLGLYYVLQAFSKQHRLRGLVLGLGTSQLALPLARTFSSSLLEIDEWRGLVLFELGLCLLALGCVLLLKLPPGDRIKTFEKLDFLTFGLFAPGVAMLCAVLALGRTVWWLEAPWVGACAAGAIVLIVASLAIEHNRAQPLLNTRWLSTVRIAKIATSVLLVRIVLSEGTGVVGFLQALGLHTDQMQSLFAIVLLGSVVGLAASAMTVTPNNLTSSLMVALACMTVGALIDAHATSLTRPVNMYLSQFLLAFGGTFFLGPTMIAGFGLVIAEPRNLVSFSVMFTITQNIGGLLGTAIVSTVQVLREKFHSSYLVEHLTLLDPNVAARVQSGGGRYASIINDPTIRNAEGVAALGTAATREANVLAYNDVFLLIAAVAIATMIWLGVSTLWERFTKPRSAARDAVHGAQAGMANVPLTNSEVAPAKPEHQ